MKEKIKFVIPTIFSRKELEIECIENICEDALNHNPENEIHVVCNFEEPHFMNWIPRNPNIKKHVSNLMFNISKALNVIAKEKDTNEFDYFCFVQSDVFFENNSWIDKCIKIYNSINDVGVIGIRPHSTFSKFNIPVENISVEGIPIVHEVLWTDGIMFFDTKHFKNVGYFDENYFGDCESQDFCYKLIESGFKNIYVDNKYIRGIHKSTGFSNKTNSKVEFENKVNESRMLLNNKWHKLHKEYNI